MSAIVRIFSWGERRNVLFNEAIDELDKTFHLSPHENILTIALINIHYLFYIYNTKIGYCFSNKNNLLKNFIENKNSAIVKNV